MRRRWLFAMSVLLFLAVSASGCATLKRWEYAGLGRDRWQHTDEVIRTLDLEPGARVADLGAGGGYFTFPLARAVGPSGAVYAIDVDPDMTEYIQHHAAKKGLTQIHTILATTDDPRLPQYGIDVLFTSNTYHHIGNRPEYFARVRPYLRPGGRVAIVDFDGRGFITRVSGHFIAPEVIRTEMQAAGYRLHEEHAILGTQTFLIFVADAE